MLVERTFTGNKKVHQHTKVKGHRTVDAFKQNRLSSVDQMSEDISSYSYDFIINSLAIHISKLQPDFLWLLSNFANSL